MQNLYNFLGCLRLVIWFSAELVEMSVLLKEITIEQNDLKSAYPSHESKLIDSWLACCPKYVSSDWQCVPDWGFLTESLVTMETNQDNNIVCSAILLPLYSLSYKSPFKGATWNDDLAAALSFSLCDRVQSVLSWQFTQENPSVPKCRPTAGKFRIRLSQHVVRRRPKKPCGLQYMAI